MNIAGCFSSFDTIRIKISLYNACFLISKNSSKKFSITKLLIDNTLNVRIEVFMKKKETKIIKTKFNAKTWIILEIGISKNFNGYYMTIEAKAIIVVQKNQVEKLVLVNIKDNVKKQ